MAKDKRRVPSSVPIPVNFETNAWDKLIMGMVAQGFSWRAIAREVEELGDGRILYRMNQIRKRYGLSVLDYRKGEGDLARARIAEIRKISGSVSDMKTKLDNLLKRLRRERDERAGERRGR